MLPNFLKKIFPKNLAGIFGLVQTIIPVLRELVMVIIRLLAILMPGKVNDELIAKVRSVGDKIEKGFDTAKRVLLGLPKI